MTGYNPDALDKEAEQAEIPEGEAEITNIEETVANEVYGEEVDFDYDPTRVMIRVTAKVPDSDVEVTDTFALPESSLSWSSPTFKLGQFRERYGEVPQEGQTVKVGQDDDGFLGIEY